VDKIPPPNSKALKPKITDSPIEETQNTVIFILIFFFEKE